MQIYCAVDRFFYFNQDMIKYQPALWISACLSQACTLHPLQNPDDLAHKIFEGSASNEQIKSHQNKRISILKGHH